MTDHSKLFRELLPMHEVRIRQRLSAPDVDLNALLDAGQEDLANAKVISRHPFIAGRIPDVEDAIGQREKLLEIIAEMIEASPTKSTKGNHPAYTAYAKALDMIGITINPQGIGHDGVDYCAKFGLPDGRTLYNRANDLQHGRKNDTDALKKKALQIIKDYNLQK